MGSRWQYTAASAVSRAEQAESMLDTQKTGPIRSSYQEIKVKLSQPKYSNGF